MKHLTKVNRGKGGIYYGLLLSPLLRRSPLSRENTRTPPCHFRSCLRSFTRQDLISRRADGGINDVSPTFSRESRWPAAKRSPVFTTLHASLSLFFFSGPSFRSLHRRRLSLHHVDDSGHGEKKKKTFRRVISRIVGVIATAIAPDERGGRGRGMEKTCFVPRAARARK